MMRASEFDPAGATENSGLSRSVIRTIGKCRIIAELGQGGMANVYLAVTQGGGGVQKLVVLKALRGELASEPDALAMFLDEARLAAQLNHPNVVQTYEVGNHGGRSVMVMEYLDGQPLSRLIRECQAASRPLPLEMGLRIMIETLEGLHYAHELTSYDGTPLELVHRDVSPQNVFVTYNGDVKVLDFGIAKAATSSTQTAAGVVKGKFAYMAPEQMSGEGVDRRADIYSVGCMLWAFAAGDKLWAGIPDGKVLRRVLSGEIPSPRTKNPDCDPELAGIVERSMAHDREQRYPTALEFANDLERFCDRMGYRVRQKDIGKLTSEVFAETRARIKSLIEEQLSKPADDVVSPSLQLLDEQSNPSARAEISSSSLSNPRSASGEHTTQALSGATRVEGSAPAKKHHRWIIPVLGLALAGATFAWWTASQRQQQAEESARAAAAAAVQRPPIVQQAPQPPPVVEVPKVTLSLNISPKDAVLYVDGVRLPPNTTSRAVRADGAKHTLLAEAPGFETATLEFVPEEGATLQLELTPKNADVKTRPQPRYTGRPRPAAAPQPAAPAPAAPTPNCSDPFFIDAGGIKRVRPECR